jgi:hypothetical protein
VVSWSAQAQIKRRWAEKNRLALETEIEGFFAEGPYPVIREFNSSTSCYHFRIEVEALPPVEEWALRMGDVIHNLRSSLDHLVYCLARECRGREVSGTAFPVVVRGDRNRTVEEVWRATRASCLRGIPPGARTIVQQFQPYMRTYGPYEPLATLHDIDISDKHKATELLAVAIGGGVAGPLSANDTGPTWLVTPVEDGAVVATWRVPGPHVDVSVHPGYVVRVDGRHVTPWSVVPLLRSLSGAVDEVFAGLLGFFTT